MKTKRTSQYANEHGLPRSDSAGFSSTVEAVQVTRRVSMWSWFAKSTIYGGREVHSRFSFAVRGSPSFVPRVFRSCFAVRGSCFAVRGSPSFVPRVFRSCFAVRGSRFAVICASRFSFVLRGSRFADICASHFTFVLRGSRFLIRSSYFLVRASQFVVRGSWWFWNRVGVLSIISA